MSVPQNTHDIARSAHDSVSDRTGSVPLGGVLPVFQTPFHEDESIDWETLDREIDWLISRRASGVVMGMVSETLRLSADERRAVAERVVCTIDGRGAVVINAAAESAHTATEFARHAESIGATAVMATPPIASALLPDEVRDYYRRVLQAIAIPVIVQDASGYVGRPLPVNVQSALLDEWGPERVFFKPEAVPLGPSLSALRDATQGRGRIFEGSGGISLLDSFRRGIVGTMPGADLIDGIVALYDALQDGDDERAYRLSMPISALVALQTGLDGFLSVEKYLLKKQGVFKNTVVRRPVGYRLDLETQREIDRRFEIIQQEVEVNRRTPAAAKAADPPESADDR